MTQFMAGECLYYYDQPLMVQGKFSGGEPGIAIVVDDIDDSEPLWLFAQLNQNDLNGFLSNKLDILSAFTKNKIGSNYTAKFYGWDGSVAELEPIQEIPNEWLWKPGVFLAPQKGSDEEQLSNTSNCP